jgi:hypothetical protein
MSGYGQFCPVAKAMELLDERWTLHPRVDWPGDAGRLAAPGVSYVFS